MKYRRNSKNPSTGRVMPLKMATCLSKSVAIGYKQQTAEIMGGTCRRFSEVMAELWLGLGVGFQRCCPSKAHFVIQGNL